MKRTHVVLLPEKGAQDQLNKMRSAIRNFEGALKATTGIVPTYSKDNDNEGHFTPPTMFICEKLQSASKPQ
ncbi:hypothetical protein BCY86_05450 [Pajaroellobacter abortibovis]|uniref:Uncharacterized protein n=1 Tax=Pajaroellobacter abortibovis TaxID=1882918 RepID=A0A1L6MXL0_9BACT|nr:hypothetical protein BCY86_05450 [Pajaroellobacter abortibovis]